MENEKQQEIWWSGDIPDFEDNTVEEVREKGNRISVSKFESLVPLYNAYLEDPTGAKLLEVGRSKMFEKEQDDSRILKNAESAIYGTQIHQLQYFTQIYERCAEFGQEPSEVDFADTFVFRPHEYDKAWGRLLKLVEDREGFSKAENLWMVWRLNGHDFTPKNNGYQRVSPNRIRTMWESEELALKVINDFRKAREGMGMDDINPDKVMLMNEAMLITNIDFSGRNMQLVSVPDEVRVPRDFPEQPIHIIDYKTGNQFRKPEGIDKLQIFLTKVAVLTNIAQKVGPANFAQSIWEIAHSALRFPHLKERNLSNVNLGFLNEEDLRSIGGVLDSYVRFSYVNPSTQERIDVTDQDLGIMGKDDSDRIINYIKGLNQFYGKERKTIDRLLKKKSSTFSLPTFPYEDFFRNGSGNRLDDEVVQESLF